MSAYRDKNITSLYSSLGYGKNSNSTYEALDVTAHSFFREYTNRGNKISVSKTKVEGARLCALNFLHEDDRGEHFWPVNSGGTLEVRNISFYSIFRTPIHTDRGA
jgi:hypothetical protein